PEVRYTASEPLEFVPQRIWVATPTPGSPEGGRLNGSEPRRGHRPQLGEHRLRTVPKLLRCPWWAAFCMKEFSAWWPFRRPPPGRPRHLGRAVDVFVDYAFKPTPPKLNRHACRPQAPISATVPVKRSYNQTVGEESMHAESAPASGEAVPPQILGPFVPGKRIRGGSPSLHISTSIGLRRFTFSDQSCRR